MGALYLCNAFTAGAFAVYGDCVEGVVMRFCGTGALNLRPRDYFVLPNKKTGASEMSRQTFTHDKSGRSCYVYRPGREGSGGSRTVGQFGGELTRCVFKYDVMQGGTDRRTKKNRTWKVDEVEIPFFQTGSDGKWSGKIKNPD